MSEPFALAGAPLASETASTDELTSTVVRSGRTEGRRFSARTVVIASVAAAVLATVVSALALAPGEGGQAPVAATPEQTGRQTLPASAPATGAGVPSPSISDGPGPTVYVSQPGATVVARFKQTKFWKAIQATSFYKWYYTYDNLYG